MEVVIIDELKLNELKNKYTLSNGYHNVERIVNFGKDKNLHEIEFFVYDNSKTVNLRGEIINIGHKTIETVYIYKPLFSMY